jgi:hypothetical protein
MKNTSELLGHATSPGLLGIAQHLEQSLVALELSCDLQPDLGKLDELVTTLLCCAFIREANAFSGLFAALTRIAGHASTFSIAGGSAAMSSLSHRGLFSLYAGDDESVRFIRKDGESLIGPDRQTLVQRT